MFDWLIAALIRFRNVLLILAILFFFLAYIPATKISIDRRIDRMFSPQDERYRHYQDFKKSFGDSETVVIGYDDAQLFSAAGMKRLESFHERLEQLPGVNSVLSLRSVFRQSAPLNRQPFSEQIASGAITPEALRAELLANRIYRGRFVTESGKTALLWLEIASSANKDVDRSVIIESLRNECAAFDPTAVVAGGPVLVDEVFTHLDRDGRTLGLVSGLVLTLVIALLFRNLRWVLLPLAVVQLALVWTKATLVLSGLQLSMVSSPLVALVTVIGVATVVHITVRYREERDHHDTLTAFRQTFKHLGPAVFWTCATTVAGFAVLIVSRVLPVRDFGIMMAIGTSMVLLATFSLAPALILMLPGFNSLPASNTGEKLVGQGLQGTANLIERYPKFVLATLSVFVLLIAAGISRLQMATDFNENFRQDSLIVRSFNFLADRLEGINVMEVVVDVPAEAMGSDELQVDRGLGQPPAEGQSQSFEQFIQALRDLQQNVEQQPRIAQSMSVADLLDVLSFGVGQSSSENARAEASTDTAVADGKTDDNSSDQTADAQSSGVTQFLKQRLFNRVSRPLDGLSDRNKLFLLETFVPRHIKRFWNRDAKVARLVVQGRQALGSQEKHLMIGQLNDAVQARFPGARVTGSYVLMVYLMDSLMQDQWITFAISILLILTMLSLAFRSFRLGLIGLIPNVTPILMVMGAMGWLGMKVNIASAMLASVSLGLSVDFSIHYISRYLQERKQGKDFFQAISAVQGSVGLAMVLANLALISGFLVLLLSSLIPTVHFGMLVSVAMMGGLLGNLFVLPLLLRYLGELKASYQPAAESQS